jgi:hypothetical protein
VLVRWRCSCGAAAQPLLDLPAGIPGSIGGRGGGAGLLDRRGDGRASGLHGGGVAVDDLLQTGAVGFCSAVAVASASRSWRSASIASAWVTAAAAAVARSWAASRWVCASISTVRSAAARFFGISRSTSARSAAVTLDRIAAIAPARSTSN